MTDKKANKRLLGTQSTAVNNALTVNPLANSVKLDKKSSESSRLNVPSDSKSIRSESGVKRKVCLSK